MFIPYKAGHAHRIDQILLKAWFAPPGGAVRTSNDDSSPGLRFISYVEHHSAVGQLDCDGLVRIYELVRAGNGYLTCMPGLAAIIAEDGSGHARPVSITAGPRGKPDWYDQSAIPELYAMVRPRCEHHPVVVFAKCLEGPGDLDRFAPCDAVVIAPLVEASLILQAKDHMDCTILVGYQDRIVIGDPIRIDAQAQGGRFLFLRAIHLGKVLRFAPGQSVVSRTAKQDVDVIPVASILAGFAPRQNGSFRGNGNAGDVIEPVAVLARCEEVDLRFFFQSFSWGSDTLPRLLTAFLLDISTSLQLF